MNSITVKMNTNTDQGKTEASNCKSHMEQHLDKIGGLQ